MEQLSQEFDLLSSQGVTQDSGGKLETFTNLTQELEFGTVSHDLDPGNVDVGEVCISADTEPDVTMEGNTSQGYAPEAPLADKVIVHTKEGVILMAKEKWPVLFLKG